MAPRLGTVLLLPSTLLFNTLTFALAIPTPPHPTTLYTTLHISNLRPRIKSLSDDEDDNVDQQLSDSLVKARERKSDEWAYLVGKLLAGVAILTAIILLLFWLWRRNVRARRRRLGEMMGLGIKRNEVLRVGMKERKKLRMGWMGRHVGRGVKVEGKGRWKGDDVGKAEEGQGNEGGKGREVGRVVVR
ncbi:hypothetical protein EK21DRAFT_118701 [Setomelanomma holmii]|uniref:Uncharacterized protein n=1 Tax=Setomelanomma holmii TaxID=210430 RepID=A0A9P4LFS6_9PLEO|nr:hypothetical protein EK21DRAFT_118701 [Setomelanomma holmii]